MRLPKIRYSLRTFLLVIALVACWFGYHLNIKRQRQELLAAITAQGGEYQTYAMKADNLQYGRSLGMDYDVEHFYAEKMGYISPLRAWLGDAPVCYIVTAGSKSMNKADSDRVAELFPEAVITIGEENMSERMRFQRMLFRALKENKESDARKK